MRQLLELFGFLALVQGGAGLLHEFTDWHIGFLDGYEVYASVTLIVPAFALFAAAGSRRPG